MQCTKSTRMSHCIWSHAGQHAFLAIDPQSSQLKIRHIDLATERKQTNDSALTVQPQKQQWQMKQFVPIVCMHKYLMHAKVYFVRTASICTKGKNMRFGT